MYPYINKQSSGTWTKSETSNYKFFVVGTRQRNDYYFFNLVLISSQSITYIWISYFICYVVIFFSLIPCIFISLINQYKSLNTNPGQYSLNLFAQDVSKIFSQYLICRSGWKITSTFPLTQFSCYWFPEN